MCERGFPLVQGHPLHLPAPTWTRLDKEHEWGKTGAPHDQDVGIGLLTRLRFWQTTCGLAATALLGCAAWRSWWPFATHPAPLRSYAHPSVWQFLLSDRVTLGFVQAVIAALVLYVAASVPALVAGGRWLRAFGTSGLTADDAQDAGKPLPLSKQSLTT